MDMVEIYRSVDSAIRKGQEPYSILRTLPLDAVGALLLHIPEEFEAARRALPTMVSDDVQDSWTGSHGYPLLLQSCAFVRILENAYMRHTGSMLDDKVILDYGCGWGRLIRLMYKFTAPNNIYGCDPWDKSIEFCRQSGLSGSFNLSEYIPVGPPFAGKRFDLIYSFSVFTHLSERCGKAVAKACREAIKDNGLMAITIRPLSYWEVHDPAQNVVNVEAMKDAHTTRGFAFTPHGRAPIDGDITYGDASMTLEYIEENWPEWKVVGVDHYLQDPYQSIVYLKPAIIHG